jgi:Transposase DDE domain group 1
MQSLRNDHHPAVGGLTALQDGVCDALFYALKKDRDWAMSRIKDNRPGLKDRLVELVKKADSEAVHRRDVRRRRLLDDVDIVRAGGMKTLFDGVYAPSTIGVLLREFTFGHGRQLESVLCEHLATLSRRVPLLPGADEPAFVDIDSLLRPVHGHAKQGASYGHTKIAGKQILRKGLSPLVTTISTQTSAPVIAGARLRAGKTNSGKGAARMIAQAVATARAAGVRGQILVRGDSAYGNSTVVAACRRAGARFSLVLTKNRTVAAAIDAIDEDAWTPVKYPGAVRDPDTGAWISDAEVAEIGFTAFASTPHAVTARLIVRRVKDARYRDALFPVWRYHPFFTNTDEATGQPRAAHYGGPESLGHNFSMRGSPSIRCCQP